MRTRRPHRDASRCSLCPRETTDLRDGKCFACYQRRYRELRRAGCTVELGDRCACGVADLRVLRVTDLGVQCLNCATVARLDASAA
jgi:hypothetical protein